MISLRGNSGFALPTIVVASLILMMVLMAALSTTTSTRTALEEQYYSQLAREAAEAGVAYANSCMEASGYVVTWTDTSRLYPGSGCYGSAACSPTSCYIYKDSQYALSFTVDTATDSGVGVQTFQVTGSIAFIRSDTGAVTRTKTQALMAKVGNKASVRNIVSGYSQFDPKGSFFGVVDPSGVFMTTGLNVYGQLGAGSTTNPLVTPQKFILPAGAAPVVAGFANNMSTGTAMFALTSSGDAYAAGQNNYGQLGVGSISATVSTPARVQMPEGKKIRTIVTAGDAPGLAPGASYFVTTDNAVYSAGFCNDNKALGYYCSAHQSTPKAVITPTADPNTQATDNIVTDRFNVYVRMVGGAVYGWGYNDYGQLGSDTLLNTSWTPVKIGTYGDPGQPKAVSIIYSDTINILDDTGTLKTMGQNSFGQMGTRTSSIMVEGLRRCITVSGSSPFLKQCDGTPSQKVTLRTDGTLYNASVNLCLTVNADNKWTSYMPCAATPGANQKWELNGLDHRIRHPATNQCLDTPDRVNENAAIYVVACGSGNVWWGHYNATLVPMDTSGMTGSKKIVMMASDEAGVSFLTDDGNVWSVGRNIYGSFGNGTTSMAQYAPVRFNIPVPAKYIGLTAAGAGVYNLYAVTSTGQVYGAGDNDYGQLGNCTTSDYSATPVQMKLLVPSVGYTPCTVSALAPEDLTAKSVVTGGGTTLVLMGSNRVFSVGNNSSGQLGDGTTVSNPEPQARIYLNSAYQLTY